jgi:hypothetical protein
MSPTILVEPLQREGGGIALASALGDHVGNAVAAIPVNQAVTQDQSGLTH